MKVKIDEKAVKRIAAEVPEAGYAITYDTDIPGFGVRVTAAGAVSFILNYRVFGRERRYTIGRWPETSARIAREGIVRRDGSVEFDGANQLRAKIRSGADPMGEKQARWNEPTFGDLLDDYLESKEFFKKRPLTQRDYRRMAEKYLRPVWGRTRLKAIQRRDVEALHFSLKPTPYQANRVVSFASRLFSYSIEEKMAETNPARNIEHYDEPKRTRFLNEDDSTEIARFMAALDSYPDQNAANALRLLLYTGSRSGEVLKAEWSQFNLTRSIWTKPSAHTKQKKTEHVSLSPQAVELLQSMKPHSHAVGPLFPGLDGKKARTTLRRPWLQVCKAAGLVEVVEVRGRRRSLKRYKPLLRTHDLRHTFASLLVSNGESLPVVGKLLGHVTPSMTQRYAHLAQDSQREAVERFGKILESERKRA